MCRGVPRHAPLVINAAGTSPPCRQRAMLVLGSRRINFDRSSQQKIPERELAFPRRAPGRKYPPAVMPR
jgi:hypothetical protein